MARRLATECYTGGIYWFRELEEKHTAALVADFRSHYNLSVFDIGINYTWREGIYLAYAILQDTTSLTFAAHNSWDYPASKEYLALLNLLDTLIQVNTDPKKSKFKPYTRPFDTKQQTQKNTSNDINDDNAVLGNTSLSREQAINLLNRMNPR